MNRKRFNSVDEYFSIHPEKTKEVLLELRDCILKVKPDAIEVINYNIVAYTLVNNGKRDEQIMIAGYNNHVGFYPHPATIEKFYTELVPYKKGKGSVQFSLNEPLPKDLIMKMVQYRINTLKLDA